MNSPQSRCELCAGPLENGHGHVVDTTDRRLLCACYACSLLFAAPGAARGRFKIIPKRYAEIPAELFSDLQWDALGIPIGLAFFFENSATQRVISFYPGPAGATESLLPLDAWRGLRERDATIASVVPDVEAVLVYRPRNGVAQAFVVPIDACYELAGLIRTNWQGIHGGDEAHRRIGEFFTRIGEQCCSPL